MSPMALTENQIKSIELLLAGMPQKQVASYWGNAKNSPEMGERIRISK
jgi:hypothetical protein